MGHRPFVPLSRSLPTGHPIRHIMSNMTFPCRQYDCTSFLYVSSRSCFKHARHYALPFHTKGVKKALVRWLASRERKILFGCWAGLKSSASCRGMKLSLTLLQLFLTLVKSEKIWTNYWNMTPLTWSLLVLSTTTQRTHGSPRTISPGFPSLPTHQHFLFACVWSLIILSL